MYDTIMIGTSNEYVPAGELHAIVHIEFNSTVLTATGDGWTHLQVF